MTSHVKTDARFGLSGPIYSLCPIFEAVGAVLKFEATEAGASGFKTEARFGLSGPVYLLGAVFEAVDGCFILIWASKKLVVSEKKNPDSLIRLARCAASKKSRVGTYISITIP